MKPLSEQKAVPEELQNAYLGINGEGANDYREKACARLSALIPEYVELLSWAERARALLEQMKEETGSTNKISGRSQREGQELLEALRP